MPWLDPNTDKNLIMSVWPDASVLYDVAAEVVATYIGAAEESCIAYASFEPGEDVPDGARLAQAMQARNIFNAAKAGTSGANDGSEYGVRTFPMDWMVKQLLRPEQGIGAIV